MSSSLPSVFRRPPSAFSAVLLGGLLLAAWRYSTQRGPGDFVVFDCWQTCAIVLPERPTQEEERAARLIQHTLAKAAGRPPEAFPIRRGAAWWSGPTIALAGKTETTGPKLEEHVSYAATGARLELVAYPADAIVAAAAWFLEKSVGARWFMPGQLGEQVSLRRSLRLPFAEAEQAPSYISRHMWLGTTESTTQAWWRHNRLRQWVEHGHAMNALFKTEDLKHLPELAPLINGWRMRDLPPHGNWQPNVASPAAAGHAAAVLRRRPAFSSAIGMNDSVRYDQSEETRRQLGEPRWFRLRPDFSPLVFRFVNEVARRVPDRYLGAYAYHWTEDTPPFPVERNVVPYLTADRSEWFDPRFAEEDKALIRRWVASGAEIVGLYDYYYGAPFLVPRPTLYAVKQTIPFAREAGVRAFFAELASNWALDGPKAWLTAQLLWDSTQDPEKLLGIYYREFWREAAEPMREFHALCDEQWLNQPKPSYWIKYYRDDHQYLLFPSAVRAQLRGLLDRALAVATTERTRQRVRFAAAGFAVTEAFCTWNETRDRLSRAALAPVVDQGELAALITQYGLHLDLLRETHARVQREHPLAVSAELAPAYLRTDPRPRAEWRLAFPAAKDGEHRAGEGGLGGELLADPELDGVTVGPTEGFFDLEWVRRGPWRGHGEPYQTRRVSLGARAAEGGEGRTALVMRGCKQETFSQFAPGRAGADYLARVRVRGQVSPGNNTFLILNFQDAQRQSLGVGFVDRLPVGRYDGEVELLVRSTAPAGTAWVGVGVRALNQVGEDFAEFAGFSLREVK